MASLSWKILTAPTFLLVLSFCSLSWCLLPGEQELLTFQRSHSFNDTMSDLIFLVDVSGSLRHWIYQNGRYVIKNGFDDEKVFVNSLLNHIRVSLPTTRVSVILFGTRATIDINYISNISPDNHKCSFKTAFNRLPFHSGMTNMKQAFELAHKIIFGKLSGPKRPTAQVKTAIFLLTDGNWNQDGSPYSIAKTLRDKGIEIFGIGVGSGIADRVLNQIATPGRAFRYNGFNQFREMAYYLRGDPYEKDWVLQPRSKCGASSCDPRAKCACGLLNGEYKCACPKGYYGSGYIGDCKLCPVATYKSFIGHAKACIPCPKFSSHSNRGSFRKSDCKCITGYDGDPSSNSPCKILQCDKFPVPDHGMIRGGTCNRDYLSECELVCKEGYELSSTGRRTCNLNSNKKSTKWSGLDPSCKEITCLSLKIPNASPESGTCTPKGLSYKTKCTIKCSTGYILKGSDVRICQLDKTWSGETVCEEVRCPKLNSIPLTQVNPPACVQSDMRFFSLCSFTCPKGYAMSGTSVKGLVRTCGVNGQWDGQHRTCVDVTQPTIKCPDAIITNTSLRLPTGLVSWPDPVYQDNSIGADPLAVLTVTSNYTSPHAFKIGRTTVTYVVRDNARLEASCYFEVVVQDNEAPEVTSCPKDQLHELVGVNNMRVTWQKPTFTDNSGLPSSVEVDIRPGTTLGLGEHIVHYIAKDKARNANYSCEIKITIKAKTCPLTKAPKNGAVACNAFGASNSYCQVSCNNNFDFAYPPGGTYLCANGAWQVFPFGPFPWPDCSVRYDPSKAAVRMQSAFYYYEGDCNSPDAQKQIKANFINLLRTGILAIFGQTCMNVAVCNADNVNVYCGATDASKRRRRAVVKEVYIKVNLVAKENPSNPKTVKELSTSLETNSRPKVDAEVKKTDWGPLRTSDGLAFKSYSLSHADAYCSDQGAVVGKCDSYVTGCAQDKTKPQSMCSCNSKSGRIEKCIRCPEGTFYDNLKEKCANCKPGTFQNKEGRFECHHCPAGTWTVGDEAKNFTACREKCKPGYFSPNGLAKCFPCPRGTYAAGFMNNKCVSCPHGTTTILAAATGREDCGMKCAPGTFSSSGVEPCKPCPKGTYQYVIGSMSCKDCDGTLSTYGPGADSRVMCIDIDDCASSPCNNGGRCVDQKDGFRCECSAGYMGKHCEMDKDECLSDPCFQGSTCVDKVNGYECVCSHGYTGKNCDVAVGLCSPSPCQNGAKCLPQPPKALCECRKGYAGEFCEMKIDLCASSPCLHDGLCKSLVDSFQCTCRPGYLGSQCEIQTDECSSNPCLNGAKCIDEVNGYRCSCLAGHAGSRCERKVLNCYPNPCQNKGACMERSNGYECWCKPNFAGKTCQTKVSPDYDLTFPLRLATSSSSVTNIPDLRAFTIAFWIRSSDIENPGTPISYATTVQGKVMDNALVLQDYGAFTLEVNNKKQFIGVSANDGHWHHVAVTWRNSDGQWVFYLDGKRVKSSTTGFQVNAIIKGGGVLVLGQEQDSLGDGFSPEEAFTGDMSQMNLWDRVLSANEIANLVFNCQAYQGNVKAWGDFVAGLQGAYVKTTRSHACDYGSKLRGYQFTYESRYPSQDHKVLTSKTADQCAVACESEPSFPCRSFDYDRTNKKCYLSKAVAGNKGDLIAAKGFDFYQTDCLDSFGMEAKAIPDSSLTASSSMDDTSGPKEARLHNSRVSGVPGMSDSRGGWSPSVNNNQQYLQVDLGRLLKVAGVATQGGDSSSAWVTSFKLEYSSDGRQWHYYPNTLSGNQDDSSVTHHQVQVFRARFVRIRPQTWHGRIALRADFYGCESDTGPALPKVLDVSIRSEGCEDPKLNGGCGHAYIKVDGTDYSPKRRGFNVVVLDGSSGQILSVRSFDTHGSTAESDKAANFLKSITGDKIVLVAIQDEGWNRATPALPTQLLRLGASSPILKDYRGSFALAGYSGTTKPTWIAHVQKYRKRGPSIVSVKIPVLSNIAAGSSSSHCSTNPCVNGGTCIPLLYGYRCLCACGYQGNTCQTESPCSDPGTPPNGRRSSSSFSHGNTITFTCNTGYKLQGSNRRKCTRGQWSGTAPQCIDINECAQGVCGQRCTNIDGSYKCACQKGYQLNADGKTCNDINECAIGGICSHTCHNTAGSYRCSCPAGMQLSKGGRSCKDKDECSINKNGCEHVCANGYLSSACFCRGGFYLESDRKQCSEKRCPSTTTPANGQQSIQGDRILGNVLTITCSPGYKLIGSAKRTCLADGKWSGPEPRCDAVRCPTIGTLKNGHVSMTAGQSYNSRATFSCNAGFALVGMATRTCQQNGQWSVEQPRCVRADCTSLSAPAHGNIEGIRREVGSTVRVSCDSGYRVTPDNGAFRTCGSDKKWTGSDPTCQIIDCGDPGTPWHGYLDGSDFTFNAVVRYRCRAKHFLEGDKERRCGSDGKWTGSLPRCLESSCGNPGSPVNGIKTGNNHTYGATIGFACNKGYDLRGSASRTCQTSGLWDGVQPTCQVKNCGNPGTPSNGHRVGNDFTYSNTVIFDCNPGYKLLGSVSRVCRETGTWSGSQASCIASNCGKIVYGPTGTIQSTNFPNNYPSNEYCTWEIRVPQGKQVRIDFQEFRTEADKDVLLIYDTGNTEPMIAFSGIKDKPRALTSSGNTLRVRFISDGGNSNNGFKLTYKQTDCGGMLTARTGEIRSPGFPSGYASHLSCTWLIRMLDRTIALQLTEFNTENSYDRLEVAHGPWVTSPLEISWSGPRPLSGDVKTPNYMWLHFYTNSKNDRFYKGFRATYKPYQPHAKRK